jgi:hypothetical protein
MGSMSTPLEALGRWSGIGTIVSGAALISVGLWARGEVRRTLARERIVSPTDTKPVRCGNAARSLAEVIRRATVDAAAGQTYAEVALYVDADGNPTSDRDRAARDGRTGEPVQNPTQALWLQSTTLQTALMQAYMGSRIADLAIGIGAAMVAAGTGITSAASHAR